MELIERINALEGEVKLVKSEIKKVLVDLRETMNSAENPFAYLEQFRRGLGGIDEERLKNLEDALERLKEVGGGNGIEEERIKNLEDRMEELKELGSVEVEKLQNLEGAIEKLAELETQLQLEKPIIHNPTALESESESELSGIGVETGTGIVDTVTLAQLMQWADTALNFIGMAKLNQLVELYELTGRISREMKDTILKVAELPDAVLSPEKGHVETKHCVTALCELDRILNGEHQEVFVLLKELCNDYGPLKKPDVKHSPTQSKVNPNLPIPGPRKGRKNKTTNR
jgi:DNA repair exonuclease SbcCD ATPase subunit